MKTIEDYRGKSITVQDYVSDELTPYSDDTISYALDGITNNRAAFSRLLQILVDKNVISTDDVYDVVKKGNMKEKRND